MEQTCQTTRKTHHPWNDTTTIPKTLAIREKYQAAIPKPVQEKDTKTANGIINTHKYTGHKNPNLIIRMLDYTHKDSYPMHSQTIICIRSDTHKISH